MQHNSIIIENQKIIKLFHNKPYQPAKIRTKNWVNIYDGARRRHKTNSQIKLKLQCYRQVSVIVVMHIYLWVEL